MQPVDVFLLDQLTAALRSAATTVRTSDLCERMPRAVQVHHSPVYVSSPCRRGHAIYDHHPYVELVECRGPRTHVVRIQITPVQLQPMLQLLRGQGRVEHHSPRYGPDSLWSWVEPWWSPGTRQAELDTARAFAAIVSGYDTEDSP